MPADPTSRAVNGNEPKDDRMNAGMGAPNSLCIPPGNSNLIFLGELTFPGRISKLTLEGKVLGVIGRSGRQFGSLSGAHQFACPTEKLPYVAETSNWRAQKIILE